MDEGRCPRQRVPVQWPNHPRRSFERGRIGNSDETQETVDPMTEDRFFDLIEPILTSQNGKFEDGEEIADPPLDVLRYAVRNVRLSWIPLLGRALSVTAFVRHPLDLGATATDHGRLLARLARAVNTRFPPWKGPVVGLTAVVLTPDPIGPDGEETIRKALDESAKTLKRMRVIPFGLIRVNLDQGAVAFSLNSSPGQIFSEPHRLADELSEHLGRFVSLIDEDLK